MFIVKVLLMANTTWFALGFISFFLRSDRYVRLVFSEPISETTRRQAAYVLKFLGGLNLALACLAAAYLVTGTFQNIVIPLITFAVAHGSQFFINLAVATRRKPLWSVYAGTMFFIFVVDGALAFLNLIAGVLSFFA